jgi:hypothetical protein
MFEQAYIEELGNHRLRHEEQMVYEECMKRGVPCEFYTAKRIHRRQLPLTDRCFVCGDMDAMHGAMKQLGIEAPAPNDFPSSLSPFFGRRIWRSTLASLETHVYESSSPVFAKPAGRRKLFTGRVFNGPDDLYEVSGVSRQEPVWCSEVVEWISEFRVYVIGDNLVSVDHYSGDPSMSLCLQTVEAAIRAFQLSGEAPAAFGIDFGTLSSGETALVEANDGYALGAYKIDASSYTNLLFTRWKQLIRV